MELRTPADFNKSVWFYDWLAQVSFSGAIRKSQINLLSFIPAQATVLIIGGGTGWILQDLSQLQLPLKITYLEAAPNMLAKARQLTARLPSNFLKITFRLGTETTLNPTETFDVIFTPFVLDLYPEEQVERMLHRLYKYVIPGGLWLVADFFITPELKGWRKWWRIGITKMMYAFFRFVEGLTTRSLPNISLQFQKLPMQLIYKKSFFQGFIQAQVYRNIP